MEAIRLNKFKVGTKAFIIESRIYIREVQVVKFSNGFYTAKFIDRDGAIRIKEARLYESRKEAEQAIGIKQEKMVPANKPPRSPHSFI